MNAPLGGKRALITGAAGGIGRETALELGRRGADVTLVDLASCEALAEELSSMGRQCIAMEADVGDEDQASAAVQRTIAGLGGLDILVNCAGIMLEKPLLETSIDEFDRIVRVNLRGSFLMGREAIKAMTEPGGGGRIINIASVAGMIGTPGFGHYCATKHAMIGMTKTMAAELGAHGITVNAVCPGFLPTPMVEHTASEIAARAGLTQEQVYEQYLGVAHGKEPIQPEQTAASVLYLASEAARVVTGSSLVIDAGWSAT